jgi:hypothetical protein
MGRSDGFPTADVSVGHLDDDKIRKLWRILGPDQGAMTEAVATHLAVVLASWGSGRRKTLDESLPLWLSPSATVVDALVSAGLLDDQHRVPARSWRRHYGPAEARRAARVEAGRLGGIRSGEAKRKQPGSDAKATLYPSGRQAGPSSPSVPDRPNRARRSPQGGATREGEPTSLGEVMRAEGGFAAKLVEPKKEANR